MPSLHRESTDSLILGGTRGGQRFSLLGGTDLEANTAHVRPDTHVPEATSCINLV